jgi:hypothetical protein
MTGFTIPPYEIINQAGDFSHASITITDACVQYPGNANRPRGMVIMLIDQRFLTQGTSCLMISIAWVETSHADSMLMALIGEAGGPWRSGGDDRMVEAVWWRRLTRFRCIVAMDKGTLSMLLVQNSVRNLLFYKFPGPTVDFLS